MSALDPYTNEAEQRGRHGRYLDELRAARKAMGFGQDELAATLGVAGRTSSPRAGSTVA